MRTHSGASLRAFVPLYLRAFVLLPIGLVIMMMIAFIPGACTTGYIQETYFVSARPESPPPLFQPAEPHRPPPGPEDGWEWIPGHWEWEGKWVWYYGEWRRRPDGLAEWVHSHWRHDAEDDRWMWIPGYWKRTSAATIRGTFPN